MKNKIKEAVSGATSRVVDKKAYLKIRESMDKAMLFDTLDATGWQTDNATRWATYIGAFNAIEGAINNAK
jgi:hypothetical protein